MVTKPLKTKTIFLSPKTQEFAQTKLELTWVKTETVFVPQATGLDC